MSSSPPPLPSSQPQSEEAAHEPQPEPPSPPTANPNPPIIQALSYSPMKKPQPIPWSHEETLNLIKAYQEKWYSLKRGQLKASQWEEVAITVAARCGLDEPSKSGTQCRHKIEKLRKRFRAEKLKLPPSFNYHNHPWIYFSLMDQLDRGPLPISAIPPQHQKIEDVDDFRNLRADNSHYHHNSSADGFFRIGRHFSNGYVRGNDFEGGKKRKAYWDDQDEDEERRDDDNIGRSSELGAQIREFADKFVKIEKKKLEMIRENEMLRNEMENKRMEMIFVSQQKTVELINNAFDLLSQNNKMNNNNHPDL